MSRTKSLERRQVTVLWCDIVGWSALAQQTDAEDLADLIRTYRRRCATVVARHGGMVAQYVGDGVLAYFGFPRAHEDDAERAVRAALSMVSAEPDGPLRSGVHIGVATGPVVVGDLSIEPAPRARADPTAEGESGVSAIGDAPNLAARLQALAAPGAIVVSEQTRRLCGGVFEYQDLGRHLLKGYAEPVQAWRVLGESRMLSRFQALRTPALTPLIGRATELQQIARLWAQAREGHGAAVWLSGEPGVGKSRLAHEIARQIVGHDCSQLWFYCSSHLQSSPLAPLIRQLPLAAGFAPDEDNRAKLRKLRTLATAASQSVRETVPLLATVLSIPYEGIYAPLQMSPLRQKQRLFQVLIDLLSVTAASRPVLFVVEDLHWIDPSSDELLGKVIDAAWRFRILTILTSRPEYQPHWNDHGRLTTMQVTALSRADALAMIASLCAGHRVPDGTAATIADRADGLPLFIEDLTTDVLEMSELHRNGHDDVRPPSDLPGTIPITLADTLMSRLDRLGSAKAIAQVGAVIGREFSYALVASVADLPEEELRDDIQRLVGAGLLSVRQSTPSLTYAFKHALVRDVAYSSLLKKEQAALHRRVSASLIQNFPDTAEAQPEVVAYHCQCAGQIEDAVRWWVTAAKLSATRSGFDEAIGQLQGALRLLETQPDAEARWQLELRVHLALGGVCAEHRGFSSEECGGAYATALDLCRRLGDPPEVFAALSGVGSFEITRGNLERCRELADECLTLAARQSSVSPFVMGHLLLGGTLFLCGRFAAAREHLENAVSLYDDQPVSRTGRQVLFVQDQKATGLCYLGLNLTIMGHLESGLRASREGLRHARALGAAHATNFSLCYLAGVHHFRHEFAEALELARESLQLSRDHGFVTWQGASQMVLGDALVSVGHVEKGAEEVLAGFEAHSGMDALSYHSFGMSVVARAFLAQGKVDEALDAVTRGIVASEQREERFYLAELLRLKGEALAESGRHEDARRWMVRALDLSRAQGARLFELRCAVALCRLLESDRRRQAVNDMLGPICAWFGSGVDVPDLKVARSMLSQYDT